jgi:glycosyltransferase involved in cell wall biosynthesis
MGKDTEDKIRILFVIATLDRAGAESQLTELAARLDRGRFWPYVAALTRGGLLEERLKRAGVQYSILGKKFKLDFTCIGRLADLMREKRFQIVHTWLFTSNAFGRVAAIKASVPIIIASERCEDPWKNFIHKAVDRQLARRTSVVVANAQAVKRFYVKEVGLPEELITVIPNGIELKEAPQIDKKSKRKELGVPEGAPLVGTVARLSKQKGIDWLLRALVIAREALPETFLLIVGEGEQRQTLEHLARSLKIENNVKFLGQRSDVPQILQILDAFVLSSRWEGMPNTILEAQAAGCPVVTTDAGGAPELVSHLKTGILVSKADPLALGHGILRILFYPQETREMAEEAKRRAADFSVDKMVKSYEDLYASLVTGHPSSLIEVTSSE